MLVLVFRVLVPVRMRVTSAVGMLVFMIVKDHLQPHIERLGDPA